MPSRSYDEIVDPDQIELYPSFLNGYVTTPYNLRVSFNESSLADTDFTELQKTIDQAKAKGKWLRVFLKDVTERGHVTKLNVWKNGEEPVKLPIIGDGLNRSGTVILLCKPLQLAKIQEDGINGNPGGLFSLARNWVDANIFGSLKGNATIIDDVNNPGQPVTLHDSGTRVRFRDNRYNCVADLKII